MQRFGDLEPWDGSFEQTGGGAGPGPAPGAAGDPGSFLGLQYDDGYAFGTWEKRDRVRLLQAELAEATGAVVAVDGMWQQQTQRALDAFQAARGLDSTRFIDQPTDDALRGKAVEPPDPTIDPSGPTVEPPAPVEPVEPSETFTSTVIQDLYDANKATLRPDQVRGLHDVDVDVPQGPWKQLTWPVVRYETARRVVDPVEIDQNKLNVCGPTTVVQFTADVDPPRYVALVKDVFATGYVNGSRADEDLLGNSPPPGMAQSDWMVTSGMRDTKNWVNDFDGTVEDNADALTTQYEMPTWMEKQAGCVETDQMDCSMFGGAMANARLASSRLAASGRDVLVALQVHAASLDGETESPSGWGFPFRGWPGDHWVRLLSPMTFSGDTVSMEIFTWGSIRTYTFSQRFFADNVLWWIVMGARKPGLLG